MILPGRDVPRIRKPDYGYRENRASGRALAECAVLTLAPTGDLTGLPERACAKSSGRNGDRIGEPWD
jgi:hypothetical protein